MGTGCSLGGAPFLRAPWGAGGREDSRAFGVIPEFKYTGSLHNMALTCQPSAFPSSSMGETAISCKAGGTMAKVGITGRQSAGP